MRSVTAAEYAAEKGISTHCARRKLRAMGAKERWVKRKGGTGFNLSKWYRMIVFDIDG